MSGRFYSAVLVLLFLPVLVACSGNESVSPTTAPNFDSAGSSTPANTAPGVVASAELTNPAILQLGGSAVDETLLFGRLTTRWSMVSGPGPVAFADPTIPDTTASFTLPGTYVLRLTAFDGEYSVTDDVTVVVRP